MSRRPRKICLAANWKMNLSHKDLESYCETLKEATKPSLKKITETLDVILGMPAPFLEKGTRVFSKENILVSAQNAHWEEKGAFTGETSCNMISEMGVKAVILGHSERRTLFKESNQDINKKIRTALSKNLLPVFCLGENLEERKSERTYKVLNAQLEAGLKDLSFTPGALMIAYEPVWAIGTGLTASPKEAHEAHSFIREFLNEHFGEKVAEKTQILYGGSMKPEVTAELLASTEIDGGLIGGASLNPESFASMLNIAYELSL